MTLNYNVGVVSVKKSCFLTGLCLMISTPAFATSYSCEAEASFKNANGDSQSTEGKGVVEVTGQTVALKDPLLRQPQANRVEVTMINNAGFFEVNAELYVKGLETPAILMSVELGKGERALIDHLVLARGERLRLRCSRLANP